MLMNGPGLRVTQSDLLWRNSRMARNLLLGQGHNLTTPFEKRSGGRPKSHHPYTFAQAKERLSPQIATVSARAASLPEEACPNGNAIVSITMHPDYLAKVHIPSALATTIGARLVGSRGRSIPSLGDECPELLYATAVDELVQLPKWMNGIDADTDVGMDFRKIEQIRIEKPAEKMHRTRRGKQHAWEVVLHASASPTDNRVLECFLDYCSNQLDGAIEIDVDRSCRISMELKVFCHQSSPHLLIGNWKYRLEVKEASMMQTVGR